MSDDKNSPNLDLIQMVQRARMQHDADALPSQVSAVYWIEYKPAAPAQQPTARAGKWVIETTADEVDALWIKVRAATHDGQLGYKSKVATASHSGETNARVIHVLTVDRDDEADVERVRAALAELGITPSRYEPHQEGA
ncbi:MAG: DUF1917 domain-containing protein [bacterium]|nr:DUF1917 domain-containing protein [bacterium]